ncbi:MAG: response regulator [Chloroflexota bacterium]|nr:response regulator [Anaerolineae bacterium]
MSEDAKEHLLLVVDDDSGMRDTLLDILEARGYRVGVAADGFEALEAIKTERCDLMLMDIVMPRMNGVEALKQLKEIDGSVIVIMMTAYAMPDLVEGALREGVYKVLFKPLDMEEVLSLIDEALSSGNGGDPSLN